ncbi:MAG: nuclear transport factor 2 family protein [Bacteroidetes bacterium]|nr:nuclear transport factor 2 family protein [Bacteroidota bacterium]
MSIKEENQTENLLKLNRRFYEAIEGFNYQEMELIWSAGEDTLCIHPGWEPVLGISKILASWEAIFNTKQALTFNLKNTRVYLSGELAVITLIENLLYENGTEVVDINISCSNVFRMEKGEWRMVVHHSSPASTVEN